MNPMALSRCAKKCNDACHVRSCQRFCWRSLPVRDFQMNSRTFRIIEDEEWLAARSAAAHRFFNPQTVKENTVSKNANTSSVYRVTEIIGTSESSWEDAAKHAVETASKTLRELRVAEVNKLDLVFLDGKVTAFRARVNLSFKYEGKD